MRILLLIQYYKPESIGPANWAHELALDLMAQGHQVTILTGFPNYPEGKIFPEYKGLLFLREKIDHIEIIRTWLFAAPSKAFWPRLWNYTSFCITSLLGGLLTSLQFDLIYAFMPPLPLGVTAISLAKARKAAVVINIQDLMPDMAVATGVLTNSHAIRMFQHLERWVYRHADHLVVISESFRRNLVSKGVSAKKLSLVSNWADAELFYPGEKHTDFRAQLNVNGKFTVVYSGGLTLNSDLEPVIEAAEQLRGEDHYFVIIGEGIRKSALQQRAVELGLANVRFLPFQTWDSYPTVLRAADMNLVTLNEQSSQVSLPSKIFKQMATGRPILAVASADSEIAQLVKRARCGLCLEPDSPEALSESLRWASRHPHELEVMGQNARTHFEQHYSRRACTQATAQILAEVWERKCHGGVTPQFPGI